MIIHVKVFPREVVILKKRLSEKLVEELSLTHERNVPEGLRDSSQMGACDLTCAKSHVRVQDSSSCYAENWVELGKF